MDPIEAGRVRFFNLINEINPKVTGVVPVRSTNNNFLISLTLGRARKFITLTEDDLIDLVEDDLIRQTVEAHLRETIIELKRTS